MVRQSKHKYVKWKQFVGEQIGNTKGKTSSKLSCDKRSLNTIVGDEILNSRGNNDDSGKPTKKGKEQCASKEGSLVAQRARLAKGKGLWEGVEPIQTGASVMGSTGTWGSEWSASVDGGKRRRSDLF